MERSIRFEMKIKKNNRLALRSPHNADFGHFTLLFSRGRQKKCTEIYNAHAQLLICSLNLLFSDVPVAAVVVVFSNSLISHSFTALTLEMLSQQASDPGQWLVIESRRAKGSEEYHFQSGFFGWPLIEEPFML